MRNILLLILDSVRAMNTSLYGYGRPTTPFLEKLAGRGLLYQNAYSPACYSIPAHTSILTGVYPSEHGVQNREWRANPKLDRVQTSLAQAGYLSRVYSQNILVSEYTGITDGFQKRVYFWNPVWKPRYQRTWFNRGYNLIIREVLRRPFLYQRGWSTCTGDTLAAILDGLTHAEQPSFVMVNLMDAHMPYHAPIRILKQFVAGEPWQHFERYHRVQPGVYNNLARPVDEQDQAEKMKLYDAAIRSLDESLCMLVDSLQRTGLLDQTMLVITADHGEMFGEHDNMVGHGSRVYQTVIKVPLLIIHPDYTTPHTITRPVNLLDLFPTCLDEAGIKRSNVSQTLAGTSLFDLESQRSFIVSEFEGADEGAMKKHQERNPKLDDPTRFARQAAIIEERYKYISWEGRETMLFDLARDPAEQTNLAGQPEQAAVQERLAAQYESWRAGLQHFPPVPIHSASEGTTDPVVAERLRELGYME